MPLLEWPIDSQTFEGGDDKPGSIFRHGLWRRMHKSILDQNPRYLPKQHILSSLCPVGFAPDRAFGEVDDKNLWSDFL